jgi:hypothetical protein
MNPVTTLTRAVVHPVQTSSSVVGQVVDLATAGAKLSARVIGWAVTPAQRGPGQAASSAVAGPLTLVDANDVSPAADPPWVHTAAADVALTEAAVTPRPSKKQTPAQGSFSTTSGDSAGVQTRSEGATAKKVPSKNVTSKNATSKNATSKKKTGKNTTARKAPSAKAATLAPALAQRGKAETKDPTPGRRNTTSGSPTSKRSRRPQRDPAGRPEPDSEPLVKPSVAKAIRSETRTLQKASDLHKD